MKHFLGSVLALLLAIPASANVTYEIEVKDHKQSPAKTSLMKFLVLDKMLKLDSSSVDGDFNGEMIFRGEGESKKMIIVNHDEKSYFVIDEEAMKEIAAKLDNAMAMMEQALANVPESQREQFEIIMKQKMPEQPVPREKTELRPTSDTDTVNNYPCVRYELWKSGAKIRDLWVTDWKNIDGGNEVADAFQEMSEFFREMMDSLPQFGGGRQSLGDPSFEHLREMKGFPVLTSEFDTDGSLESEATLKSATSGEIDPDAFDPPKGYMKKEMFRGQ